MWSCKINAQHKALDYGKIASVADGTFFADSVLSVLGADPEFYENRIKLVYFFNGDCSNCISAYFTFLTDWQKLDLAIPAFFIASAPHIDIVDLYMERASLKLQKSLQFLLNDNNGVTPEYNPYMDEVMNNIYILLINEESIVVEHKNPFVEKTVMSVYKKMDSEFRDNFSLQGGAPDQLKKRGIMDIIDENDPPLILINGKEKSLLALKGLIDKISDFSYFEGSAAVIGYGEKAKNGVLIVTTK